MDKKNTVHLEYTPLGAGRHWVIVSDDDPDKGAVESFRTKREAMRAVRSINKQAKGRSA
jgi:hypothetical protein